MSVKRGKAVRVGQAVAAVVFIAGIGVVIAINATIWLIPLAIAFLVVELFLLNLRRKNRP